MGHGGRSCRSRVRFNDGMKTVLETERLILREMTEADADNLLALNRSPNVTRYVPGEPPLRTRDDALVVLRERVFPQYERSLGRWACIVKTSGDFIGWCGVKHEADLDETSAIAFSSVTGVSAMRPNPRGALWRTRGSTWLASAWSARPCRRTSLRSTCSRRSAWSSRGPPKRWLPAPGLRHALTMTARPVHESR